MGSADFATIHWTDKSLRDAYQDAVNEACAANGNVAYNGTISTTNGVSQVLVGHTMTGSGAAIVSGWMNNGLTGSHPEARGHKWEDAKAIAVASEDAFTYTTKTLTFTVDDLRTFIESTVEDFDSEWARNERLRVAQECPEHYLYDFTAAKVSEAFPLHTVHAVEHSYTPKVKLVTRRSQVKPVTVYEVVDARGATVTKRSTRALANAFIKDTLSGDSPRHTSLGVRAVKVYEDIPGGTASVTERQVASAKITVTVTLATPKREFPKYAKRGWLFYGMASI